MNLFRHALNSPLKLRRLTGTGIRRAETPVELERVSEWLIRSDGQSVIAEDLWRVNSAFADAD